MLKKNTIKAFLLCTILTSVQAASFKMTTVGAPGNTPDTSRTRLGRGRVDYRYRLATAPVSNSDYAEFLNAVAQDANKGLYDKRMAISRTENSGNYKYSSKTGFEDKPISYVSYANAASYCNWLSKGQVYNIVDGQVTRRRITFLKSSEVFFIPTHDEWYKGMYYKNGKYKYGIPLKVAEMVETRHRFWHRIAIGHSKNPEAYIKCNNYTNNITGKSEDNIRLKNIGFRVASMPVMHASPELNSGFNYFDINKQNIVLRVRAKNNSDIKLKVSIYDLWKHEVYNEKFDINVQSGVKDISIKNVVKKTGYYTLKSEISSEGKTVSAMQTPFVMMDRKQAVVREKKSAFGISTHLDRMLNCWGRVAPEEYLPILKDMGVSWVRTDFPWKYVTKKLVDNGFHILAFFPYYNKYSKFDSPFKSTPLSEKWKKYGIPRELSTYAEKCYKIVKDYPHVNSWEVGNEPHGWNITPADYAQLVKAAYKAAKLADPSTTVVMGDMNHTFKSVIGESGAAAYSDAVAIHTYGFFKKYHEGVIDRIETLIKYLNSYGFKNKPIWVTEISGCGYWNHIYPGKTEDERYRYQALDMPKKLAGTIAIGGKKVFIYEFIDTETNHTEGEFGVIRTDLLPKPAFMAYRTTAIQLAGIEYKAMIKLPKNDFTGLLFGNNRKKTAVIWKEDKPATLVRRKKITLPMVKISKPENIIFKASGKVYMVDIMGTKTELQIKNGRLSVPVNEYPVFVTGNIDYDLVKPSSAATAQYKTPAVKVQILPPIKQMYGPNDLHNMQHVVRIRLKRQTPQYLDVRVHNQSKKDQSGKLYLVAPGANSDAGWLIKPRIANITVPAESTATVRFNINILRRPYTGESPYILKAVFESGNNKFVNDVIVYQMIKRVTNTKNMYEDVNFNKITGKKQYTINPKYKHIKGKYQNNVFNINVSNGAKHFVLFDAVASPVISEDNRLSGILGFSFLQKPGIKVVKINIRLIDRDGEIFQYQKRGKIPVDKWIDVKFDLKNGKPALSWGKKKNGKFDYPVKWQSIIIDFRGDSGEISVSPTKYWIMDK